MNKFYFLLEQENKAPSKVLIATEDKKILLDRKLPCDSRFSVRCVNGYLHYLETRCNVDSQKFILTETDWYKEWKSYMKYIAEQDLIPVDDIIDFAFSYSVECGTELDAS